MFPMHRFVSESAAADLLEQVRWRNGVECPRCRSDRAVRNGSYREFQRYLCKNCGRSFNDKTGTIFAHSKLKLKEWYFTIYTFLRFNTSIRQIEAELDLSYRTLRERVEQFARTLDAPSISLSGPVEIDECTSPLDSRAASAPKSRARVACPREDAARTRVTNHQCSHSLTVVRTTAT